MNSAQLEDIKSRASEILIQFTNGRVNARLSGTNTILDEFNSSLRVHYLYGVIEESYLIGSDVYIGSKQVSASDFAEVYQKLWNYNGINASIDLSSYSDIVPDSGDGDSGTGGGVVINDQYRAGEVSVSSGASTITFSSPLPNTNYVLDVYVRTPSGYEQRNLGTITKFTNGFTVSDVLQAGTLTYTALIEA